MVSLIHRVFLFFFLVLNILYLQTDSFCPVCCLMVLFCIRWVCYSKNEFASKNNNLEFWLKLCMVYGCRFFFKCGFCTMFIVYCYKFLLNVFYSIIIYDGPYALASLWLYKDGTAQCLVEWLELEFDGIQAEELYDWLDYFMRSVDWIEKLTAHDSNEINTCGLSYAMTGCCVYPSSPCSGCQFTIHFYITIHIYFSSCVFFLFPSKLLLVVHPLRVFLQLLSIQCDLRKYHLFVCLDVCTCLYCLENSQVYLLVFGWVGYV